MRVFGASVKKDFLQVSNDHRTALRIPGGEQVKRANDASFQWNRLARHPGRNTDSEGIPNIEFLFCQHTAWHKNSIGVRGKLVHQNTKLLRGKIPLPIGGGGEGEPVDAKED